MGVAERLIFAKAEDDDPIRRAADRAKVKLTKGFLDAVKRVQDSIDMDALVKLIEQGRLADAIALVDDAAKRIGYGSLLDEVADAFTEGGRVSASIASTYAPGLISVHFDVVNPGTTEVLRTYQADMVRGLDERRQAAVTQAVVAGVTEGRGPLDVARDVRAAISLTPRQEQAVRNFRRMLEEGEREVLDRALRDRRFDASVARAVEGEKPLKPEQIERMVERYRERYLKYRSETIARLESARAVSMGSDRLWKQAVEDGTFAAEQIRKGWIYTADGKVRHAHSTIPTRNPKGVGLYEAFDSELGPIRFPGDPNAVAENLINCRCTAIYRVIPVA